MLSVVSLSLPEINILRKVLSIKKLEFLFLLLRLAFHFFAKFLFLLYKRIVL